MLAFESGTTATTDPFGGSYYIEVLTDELERGAQALIDEIDDRGGAVAAIESGSMQDRIEDAAFAYQRGIEHGALVVVGVNRYQDEGRVEPELHRLDPAAERAAGRAHARVPGRPRRGRGRGAPGRGRAPRRSRATSTCSSRCAPPSPRRCTVGEICDVLRDEWGTYDALIAGGR